MSACSWASRRTSLATVASRPRGARINVRVESSLRPCVTGSLRQRIGIAVIGRHTAQYPLERLQWLAHADAGAADGEFADRGFVPAAAFLHHRDRAANAAPGLEIANEDHGVGKVSDIDVLAHVAHQAVLGHGEE